MTKPPIISVQITSRGDISRFTGLPIESIPEGTIFQVGPCVAEIDYLALESDSRQLYEALTNLVRACEPATVPLTSTKAVRQFSNLLDAVKQANVALSKARGE